MAMCGMCSYTKRGCGRLYVWAWREREHDAARKPFSGCQLVGAGGTEGRDESVTLSHHTAGSVLTSPSRAHGLAYDAAAISHRATWSTHRPAGSPRRHLWIWFMHTDTPFLSHNSTVALLVMAVSG